MFDITSNHIMYNIYIIIIYNTFKKKMYGLLPKIIVIDVIIKLIKAHLHLHV